MDSKKLLWPHILRKWLFAGDDIVKADAGSEHRPFSLFLLCIVSYCLYLILMQPSWVLGGEMWAEMGSNYFPAASSPSILVKLFTTDAGYIPLPQRILAACGDLLNFSASSIAYFYTWSAIVLTGAMIGVFCLKPFRLLVSNDFLRFFSAITILLIADFETRTFINFTYFSAFFIAILTALALVDRSRDVPWWAWFIPIMILSKPTVLSVLPAMIVVAYVSKARFRLITALAVLFCFGQMIQMYLSNAAGQ